MTPDPIEELRVKLQKFYPTVKDLDQLLAAYDAKCAEVEAERKQHKIDNEGNQEWINSLCEQLCKMEDALGFKNDAYDKKGKWVPTIGPWMERLRDLLAAEGGLGDLKEALQAKCAEVERLKGERDQYRNCYLELKAALDTANAHIAVLREALEKSQDCLSEFADFNSETRCGWTQQANKKALDTTIPPIREVPPTNEPTGEVNGSL